MEKRIVASLDLTDEKRLIQIAGDIGESVFAVKINWPTILALGKSIIGKLSKYSKVICDLKIADIPNTNRLIMEQVVPEGPFGVITHIFPGTDSLKEVINSAGNTKVLGVVAMSNPGAKEMLNKHHESLLVHAKASGCFGIIAPGNDYELLSIISRKKENLKIFSPGVGRQGGELKMAIENGSDYVIIGRAIYESENPVKYIEKLQEWN